MAIVSHIFETSGNKGGVGVGLSSDFLGRGGVEGMVVVMRVAGRNSVSERRRLVVGGLMSMSSA